MLSGALDSLSLKNEVELGMGIEDEIIRTVVTTKGKWVTSEDYTLLPFAITFQIEGVDKSKKSKFTDHLVVVAYGIPATPSAHCVSTDDLIKKFEKAKKKQDKAEMLANCEELLRRLPESAEYKTEWTLLKNK